MSRIIVVRWFLLVDHRKCPAGFAANASRRQPRQAVFAQALIMRPHQGKSEIRFQAHGRYDQSVSNKLNRFSCGLARNEPTQ